MKMISPNSIELLKELAASGTVCADHFVGRGKWIPPLVAAGYAEWIRGRQYSNTATALKVTEAGREHLASLQ